MNIISPSILAADFLNLEQEIKTLNNSSETWVHLDIMDGHFVPNLTFGFPIIKKISNKAQIPLDAHLMVTNPDFHIDQLKDLNLHNITFHYEAVNNPLNTIKLARDAGYPSVGMSIKPNTKVSDVEIEVYKSLDLLLVMSVEPGFGGQKFIANTWDKLEELQNLKKDHNPQLMIQVDGGINRENAPSLWKAGANNLVAGSYVFKDGRDKIIQKIQGLRV